MRSTGGDLREQCLESAVSSSAAIALLRAAGHDPAQTVAAYGSSPLRAEVVAWRRDMSLHRVSLVIQGVTRWLDREGAGALDPAQLALLASDAGPLAGDLARWLRARELDAETRA